MTKQKALQRAKMSYRKHCYAWSVRMPIEHLDNKDPKKITEEELKAYFLFRRNECKWTAATLRICYSGLKFFFQHVLQKTGRFSNILIPK